MADNVMDYQAILADMEAKRATLDRAIASLREAMAVGAVGVVSGVGEAHGSATVTGVSGPGPSGSDGDIPKGAFHGRSIPEAITLYLATVRKRCQPAEIVAGLKKGGVASTSKHFSIVVRNTMGRLKNDGKLLLFDDGWGLPEWAPEGLRSRIAQQSKPHKKPTTRPHRKGSGRIPLQDRIAEYFSANRSSELTGQELAHELKLNGHGIGLVAYQMVKHGMLEKTASGKFRAPSKVTPITKAG